MRTFPSLSAASMAALVLALALALVAPASAASPTAVALPQDWAGRCAALAGEVPGTIDAPTRIDSGRAVAQGGLLPAYCDVSATTKPDIGVGIRLPLDGWNGKMLLVARGGFCRPVEMSGCDAALAKGYACAITDHGHKVAGEQDDVWAHGNLQAQVDCGFRGAHVAAEALKT